ncbi:unnamed protein product [Bursaphelenchus xylophilus]|uniref:(pine wood nematode) hypothetical protein n=1 Tax=Bursaphelenchus xylophilus TaxID=6326 RepID=A0A1I7RSK8_BURXY|nr:unnamed protein product [Bursaphelenchus xylophilus]CAG9122886.1 unnamed protein product [Bursaphelenchus xylophilus]
MSVISTLKHLIQRRNQATLSCFESPREALLSDGESNIRLQREFLARVNDGKVMKVKKITLTEPLLGKKSFKLD